MAVSWSDCLPSKIPEVQLIFGVFGPRTNAATVSRLPGEIFSGTCSSRRLAFLDQAIEMQPDMRRLGRRVGERDHLVERDPRPLDAAELHHQAALYAKKMEIAA